MDAVTEPDSIHQHRTGPGNRRRNPPSATNQFVVVTQPVVDRDAWLIGVDDSPLILPYNPAGEFSAPNYLNDLPRVGDPVTRRSPVQRRGAIRYGTMTSYFTESTLLALTV